MTKAQMLLLAQPRHKDLQQAALWMANLAQHVKNVDDTSKGIFTSSLRLYGRYIASDEPKYLSDASTLLGATLKLATPRVFEENKRKDAPQCRE